MVDRKVRLVPLSHHASNRVHYVPTFWGEITLVTLEIMLDRLAGTCSSVVSSGIPSKKKWKRKHGDRCRWRRPRSQWEFDASRRCGECHIYVCDIAQWPYQKIYQFIRRCRLYAKMSASQTVLSRMQLTLYATSISRRLSLGESNVFLVGESPTCSVPALYGCEDLWPYGQGHT